MLETINLSCGYNHKPVIKGVDIRADSKQVLGIIGPNGSGKTTLLRAITRIIKPSCGRIIVDGIDINDMSQAELARNIAVVSQKNQDSGFLTVEEYVMLGRMPYHKRFQFFDTKEDYAAVARYMELTGILEYKDHFMDKISGGEKQLAVIARALVQEPKILLLDEPTSYLDITHQTGILDLIKRLNAELGLTVVMVLHDLNLAGEYCDKLVMLNKGLVHKAGTPWEVLEYKNIEEVYKTIVVVRENPISKRPHVVLVSEEARNNSEKEVRL